MKDVRPTFLYGVTSGYFLRSVLVASEALHRVDLVVMVCWIGATICHIALLWLTRHHKNKR